MENFEFKVTENTITETFSFDCIDMVKVEIAYPVLSGGINSARNRINRFYKHAADAFLRYAKCILLPSAIETYKFAQENSYPFMPYELNVAYCVTKNDCQIFSVYRDAYEFTGGAHGNTIRYGDTWSSCTGWPVQLKEMFPPCTRYRRILTDNAIEQARRRQAAGFVQYFDDFEKLIRKYFRPSNFYITPDGIAIFYQQYEIAPYVAGIQVFIYENTAE